MLDERISAATKRFAVLGESLGHTWSPYIHNSLFALAKRDAVYIPVTIPRDKLSSAADVLRSCFSGFNVTIPYKEKIIPFLDEVDDAVKACGAVNTVEIRDGRMIGHITDGLGMLSAIRQGGIATEQADVLILGGGGAARVACYEFLARGGRVTFAVRDIHKGMQLADEMASVQADGSARIRVAELNHICSGYDILINCTPVGMYPLTDASPVSMDIVKRCGAVFDAVYNPRETRLIAYAKACGVPSVEGLGMLFYQAVEAQKYWFDDMPSLEDQATVYRDLCRQL